MEIEDNHRTCKRSRVGNGKLRHRENQQDDDEDKGEVNNTPMRPWHHPSSRIFRVSRASGGKDRHSKVYTSKGLRDRRVRLSVSTAIQFYDLQDRLGYDQPSKAIEWLIKAASSAIAELPSLDTNFPEPLNMERPMLSDSGVDPEVEPSYNQQQHSSTSETSKGSVLSLSRCENRIKARERARERVKDKEKDKDETHVVPSHHQSLDVSLNSQGSFTKLLTGGSSISGQAADGANFIQKQVHNLLPVTSTADYLGAQSGLFSHHHEQQQEKTTHSISSVFSSQAQFGNGSPIAMATFSNAGGNESSAAAEMQPFAFLQDHFFPAAAAAAAANRGDYNLNFSISPGLAGFQRGTLQSNTTSHHHHYQLSHHHHHQVQAQRFSASMDGPSVPFFFGVPATAATAVSSTENPYSAGFDGHLQLCDGSYRQLELKGKGKS